MEDIDMNFPEGNLYQTSTSATNMSYTVKMKADHLLKRPRDLASAIDEIQILEAIMNSKDKDFAFKEEINNNKISKQSEELKDKERLLIAKDKIITVKEKKLARLEREIVRLMDGDEAMERFEEKLSEEKMQEQVKKKAARKALKKEKTERKQTAKRLQVAGEKRAREDTMSDDELLSRTIKRVNLGRIRKSRSRATANVEEHD